MIQASCGSALVAMMIAGYVVLDEALRPGHGRHTSSAGRGFPAERRSVLASIGPVWDGNEVWLLAGGGTLYFAFPELYASSFRRILFASDDGSVVADSARGLDRIPRPPRIHRHGRHCGMPDSVCPAPYSRCFYGAALGKCRPQGSLGRQQRFLFFRCGPILRLRRRNRVRPGILDWYTIR